MVGMDRSVVIPFDIDLKGHSCGYCNSTDKNISYGMWALQLQPDHYKALMDRGWRRSGCYLYKPIIDATCCPPYTIRLPVDKFCFSRSHRKVVKKIAKQLDIKLSSGDSFQSWMQSIFTDNDKFRIEQHKSEFDEKSFEIYKKYQKTIHHDSEQELTRSKYKRFLVDSPMPQNSFHYKYFLGNQLIAVGVVDILESYFSSVYFFYDPDYSDLSLGKFSALAEIYFADEYYYMGFYIPSCNKMRYKADFRPSELLDLKSLRWKELDKECQEMVDRERFCYFSELPEEQQDTFCLIVLQENLFKVTISDGNGMQCVSLDSDCSIQLEENVKEILNFLRRTCGPLFGSCIWNFQ